MHNSPCVTPVFFNSVSYGSEINDSINSLKTKWVKFILLGVCPVLPKCDWPYFENGPQRPLQTVRYMIRKKIKHLFSVLAMKTRRKLHNRTANIGKMPILIAIHCVPLKE